MLQLGKKQQVSQELCPKLQGFLGGAFQEGGWLRELLHIGGKLFSVATYSQTTKTAKRFGDQ